MPCFHTCASVIMTLLMMRDTASCHNWVPVPILLNLLIEDTVKDRFLSASINVTWGLWLLRQNDTCSTNGAIVQT